MLIDSLTVSPRGFYLVGVTCWTWRHWLAHAFATLLSPAWRWQVPLALTVATAACARPHSGGVDAGSRRLPAGAARIVRRDVHPERPRPPAPAVALRRRPAPSHVPQQSRPAASPASRPAASQERVRVVRARRLDTDAVLRGARGARSARQSDAVQPRLTRARSDGAHVARTPASNGYVWREASPDYDRVCVTFCQRRSQAGPRQLHRDKSPAASAPRQCTSGYRLARRHSHRLCLRRPGPTVPSPPFRRIRRRPRVATPARRVRHHHLPVPHRMSVAGGAQPDRPRVR